MSFAPFAHGEPGLAAEDGLEERHRTISAEGGDFLDGDVAAFEERHRLFDPAFLDCVKYGVPGMALE